MYQRVGQHGKTCLEKRERNKTCCHVRCKSLTHHGSNAPWPGPFICTAVPERDRDSHQPQHCPRCLHQQPHKDPPTLNLVLQVHANSPTSSQSCKHAVCITRHWKQSSAAQRLKNPERAERGSFPLTCQRQQAHSHTAGGNWVSACFQSHSHHSPMEEE